MWSFKLTPEQRLARETARKFMQREVEPLVADLDEHRVPVWPLIRKYMNEVLGADSIHTYEDLAEAVGSRDFLVQALGAIETCRVCPGFALSLGASLELAGYAIWFGGTREQIEKYAIPIFRGDKIGSWGLTEPEAGSDVQGLKTTAKKVEGGYELSGSKTFISNAPVADTFVIYAQAPAGITAFVVERGAAGLSTSEPFDKMGHRASPTGAIYLDGVFVPEAQRLGDEGQGFWLALNNLNHERASTPAISIGIMERCLEEATAYAKVRTQFGRTIGSFQGVQFMLARMWEKLQASYAFLFTLAQMEELGLDYSALASAAKLQSTEAATAVALEAVQIMGGYGYMREYKVERFVRDAKLMEIGAGTSQIQLLIMARQLLKMDPVELDPLFAGPSPFRKKS